jgi:hypothetical protein
VRYGWDGSNRHDGHSRQWGDALDQAVGLEFDRCELLIPLHRKILDLLEIQDRWFALSDDCRPLPLLG